jgi:Domain of unknown function (DUF4188)
VEGRHHPEGGADGQVVTGRYTAQADGSLVVFLIGMRINHLWAVRKWVPTFLAMAQLLPRLFRQPDRGSWAPRRFSLAGDRIGAVLALL